METESVCGIRESCGGPNYHHRDSRKHQISTTLNSHLSLYHPLFLPITKAAVELSAFGLCSSAATWPDTLGKKGTSLSFSLSLHRKINLEIKDKCQWGRYRNNGEGFHGRNAWGRCFSDALSAAFQKSSSSARKTENFKIRYLTESSADEQLLFRVSSWPNARAGKSPYSSIWYAWRRLELLSVKEKLCGSLHAD